MPAAQIRPEPGRDRDFPLDFVRAVAIVEVVLAHSDVPPLLFQLRNFGVPLLLLISGMAFALSFRDRPFSVPGYILRRIRKLLIPTWVFLGVFFVLMGILNQAGIIPGVYPPKYILDSFLLLNSAEYVWVIRVNLLVSLLAGVLLFIDRRAGNWQVALVVILLLVANELLWMAFVHSPFNAGMLGDVIVSNLFYALSYGAIFLLGMRISRLSRWALLGLALLFALVCAGFGYWYWRQAGHFVQTQDFKYPPQAYYIAYAMAISLAILAFRNELAGLVPAGWPRRLLGFMGANTLWIYLWHILALRVVARLSEVTPLPDHWLVTWVLTVVIAVFAAWLQKALLGGMVRLGTLTERPAA